MVEEVFNNAIDCLSDEDKKLPQVSGDWIGFFWIELIAAVPFSATCEAVDVL